MFANQIRTKEPEVDMEVLIERMISSYYAYVDEKIKPK